MKTTYRWLKDFLPEFTQDAHVMARHFTATGTEVETQKNLGTDTLLEVAVTSNRVDCLGMIGLAREIAVASGTRLSIPEPRPKEGDVVVESLTSVSREDTTGCPRFTAQVIQGVRVGPSPAWLVERLTAIGARSVNNVVDATNYAMFVTNQPFHAFDFDRLSEKRIVVRKARSGEKLTAINGRIYELSPDITCICDAARPVAIAGVMGSLETEVGDQTTNVLLETACFDRVSIRTTARRLGLSSDASFRFERGVDGENTLYAARYCAELIQQIAGGTLASGIIDSRNAPAPRREITLRRRQIQRITGIEIPWARCQKILESLGLQIAAASEDDVSIVVASHRSDLEREIDLIEEIIRVYGLEHIPVETSMTARPVVEAKKDRVDDRLRNRLVAAGFHEALTTSFTSAEEAEWCLFADTRPITIRNAMRSDENALRQSLMPSLLRARALNQSVGNQGVRLAELTTVYLPHREDEIPEHLPILGFLMDGSYREARGILEDLGHVLGLPSLGFRELNDRGSRLFSLAGSASIILRDQVIGFVGTPRPEVLKNYDLKLAPIYAEVRLDFLRDAAELVVKCRPLPVLPAVHRDLALVVAETLRWGELEHCIRNLAIPELETIHFFDEYRGKQVPAGKKSLAFSLVYRHPERTLTSEEVDQFQEKIITTLTTRFQATIRL